MGRGGDASDSAQLISELENAFVLTRAQLEAVRESAG